MSNVEKTQLKQEADDLIEVCSKAITMHSDAMSPNDLYGMILGADEYAYAIFYHSAIEGFVLTISHSGAAWGGQPIKLNPSPGEVEFGEITRYTQDLRGKLASMNSFSTQPQDINWEAFDSISRAIQERGEPGEKKS